MVLDLPLIDVYKRFSPDFGWSPDFDQNKVLELSNNSYIIVVFSEVSLNSILPDWNPQRREKTNFSRLSLMMMMMMMMMSKFVGHKFL